MSFIPPTCIHIKEATHQYLVLHGIVESTFTSDFPPNVMMVPADLCVAAERKETKVTAYFLNAYLAADHQFNHPVTFSFPGLYYSLSLPPHSAESRELSLHDGDCFKVHTKGQSKTWHSVIVFCAFASWLRTSRANNDAHVLQVVYGPEKSVVSEGYIW